MRVIVPLALLLTGGLVAGLLIERSGIGGGLVAVITLTVLGVAWSMLGVGSGTGRARSTPMGGQGPREGPESPGSMPDREALPDPMDEGFELPLW